MCPGFDQPGPDVICGLSLLLVLFPAPRTITSKFNSSLECVLDLWISAKALDTFDTQVKGCLFFFIYFCYISFSLIIIISCRENVIEPLFFLTRATFFLFYEDIFYNKIRRKIAKF